MGFISRVRVCARRNVPSGVETPSAVKCDCVSVGSHSASCGCAEQVDPAKGRNAPSLRGAYWLVTTVLYNILATVPPCIYIIYIIYNIYIYIYMAVHVAYIYTYTVCISPS